MKWLKNCPYLKIKETEETIEREKQVLFYMKSEAMKYEKALQKSDIETLYRLEKNYHDGFLWPCTKSADMSLEIPLAIEKLGDQQEMPKRCQDCSYAEQNCQELLSLRKSRAAFLRKQITQATSYHNEVMELLNATFNHYIKYPSQKENLFMMFHMGIRLSLVYFNIEYFKPSENGHYAVCLLYQDEKTLEIKQEWIAFEYQVASLLLEGTYLIDVNQKIKLIRVYLPSERIEGFEEPIMGAMSILLKVLNKRFGRNYGQIKGVYMEIAGYAPGYQMQLIKLLEPLGYKVLGQVNNQGVFEEKRLLLYLCKSFL